MNKLRRFFGGFMDSKKSAAATNFRPDKILWSYGMCVVTPNNFKALCLRKWHRSAGICVKTLKTLSSLHQTEKLCEKDVINVKPNKNHQKKTWFVFFWKRD